MKKVGQSSPWGKIQYVVTIADGIQRVITASHGGIFLSRARVAQMPKKLRLGRRQWFEEDCEAGLVVESFPEHFAPKIVQAAKKSNAHFYSV